MPQPSGQSLATISLEASPAIDISRSARPAFSWLVPAAICLVAPLATALLWPGDTVWFWDEPMEIATALQANQRWHLAMHGLSGGFALPYGAMGIHLYQLWLLFTHDPRILTILHAITCIVPTAIGLLWLSRTLRLSPWFAVAVMMTPHLWFESRRLWQPSFCIPLSTLAVAGHASFLRGRSGRSLTVAVGCALAPLFIHLQAIPLSFAILGHLVWKYRPEIRQHRRPVAWVVGTICFLNLPYIGIVLYKMAVSLVGFVRAGHGSHTALAEAWWGPLMGGRLFSGYDWVAGPSRLWGDGASQVLRVAGLLSAVAIPLVWMGIGTGIAALLRVPVRGRDTGKMPVLRPILAVCLAALGVQLVIWAIFRLSATHHYFFGMFGVHVLLAWVAVDALSRIRLGGLVTAVYGLGGALITLAAVWHVHQHSWPRWLSPTLNEQIALVQSLNHYSDASARTEVPVFIERPEILWTLRQLLAADPGASKPRSGQLFIRYRVSGTGQSGSIEVVETGPGSALPAGARLIPLLGPGGAAAR